MKRNMLRRSTLREIKGSFGRFMAILSIIALGVGFFSGVRITTPAMVETVDRFLRDKELFDYRLLSALGWEEQDVQAFQQAENVRWAEGSNSLDILCNDKDGTEFVLKSMSLPQHVNLLELTEGRYPERENECLIDAGLPGSLSVGDTVYVADGNEEDTLDALRYRAFVIVGAGNSPLYLNFERGTTSIGNGSVSAYLYILNDAYDRDYYSEIYVRFDHDERIYAQSYKDAMDARTADWETLTQNQAEARWHRILDDAEAELADGKDELADKRAEGEQELADAEAELADGKKELDDAAQEIADAEAELANGEQELADGEQELADAKKSLDEAEAQLADSAQQIADGEAQLTEGKQTLDDSRAQLDEAKAQLDDSEQQILSGEAQLNDGQAQLDAARAQLEQNAAYLAAQEAELNAQAAALEAQLAGALPVWDYLPAEQQAQLAAAQEQISAARTQIEDGKAQITAGRQELDAQQHLLHEKRAELDAGRAQWEEGYAQYQDGLARYEEGLAQYEESEQAFLEGKQQYEDGLAAFEEGRQKYEDGLKELEDARQKLEDGKKELADGKQDYEEGLAEYQDGLAEYEDGRREFDEKIADAEAEIADAEAEIADIKKPDSFVLDRYTNIGYNCFESDSQIVEQVARVFPVFFILVAALVCMTTMSRMVEEQRGMIGTLKALGYGEGAIMGKFAFYAGSAALIGCVLGYGVGSVLFPNVIWMSYQLMYIDMKLAYVFDWKLAILAVLVSLLCSIGTTWLSCRIELSSTAASLMRPKAPKAGKRIFLEYLPFLWNRLKFLHKVSIRNIFRYKGRLFMMIAGIGGCTALLLTGFGLKDSVAGFADVQYGEIVTADATMLFKSDIGGALPSALQTQMDDLTEDYMLLHEASWDIVYDGGRTKGMSLIMPVGEGDFGSYMTLRTLDGEPVALPGDGEIAVSNAVAERFGAVPGSTVTLRNEEMEELHVRVTGVFENHVYNYIILSPETFRTQLGEEPKFNAAYLNFPENADVYQAAAELTRDDDVQGVTVFADLRERMGKMMGALDYVVLLVILCAAGLAFIVLYNLTNINITERLREIATIKVLGFFRSETSAYVLRENLVLTGAGVLAGLVLGIWLHRFVISQIIVDLVSFKTQILPMSFVLSIVLTFVFNFIVNLVMGRKLDRINMAESLKSVD